MAFDWRGFMRFCRLAFLDTTHSNRRLTPKRLSWALGAYALYPSLELVTWAGLGLDNLVCPGYKEQEIREPVFIVGNPRSGTTFLHRLMARDARTFACMNTWEILFAPSIVSRRLVKGLGALDERLGGPLQRVLLGLEHRWQDRNVMHWQALCTPEEDEALMLHTFSSVMIWTFCAMPDEARAFTYYDQEISQEERRRQMSFYRRCLQRYLHSDGCRPGVTHRHYRSKNPSFCFRIDSLLEQFPDARFVYVMRNPLDVVPSLVSILKFVWTLLGDPVEYASLRSYVFELVRRGYQYPLERLQRLGQGRCAKVRFDDLIRNARQGVAGVYRDLGLELNPAYARVLDRETERARQYQRRHHYSMRELGLSRTEILYQCREAFERFGFDRRECRSIP